MDDHEGWAMDATDLRSRAQDADDDTRASRYAGWERQSPYPVYPGPPDTHIGATQPMDVGRGLLDGISIAQIIAASAAAATSMLLASRIGIAGSVIGAAVSSMVTVTCSQLYRNALDASARKLKEKQALAGGPRACEPKPGSPWAGAAGMDGGGGGGVWSARIAPTKLQARAAAERSSSKRKVALASIAIAAIAVAVCAGIIMLGTSGEGLGAKTAPIFQPTAQPSEPAPGPADELVDRDAHTADEMERNRTEEQGGVTETERGDASGTGPGEAARDEVAEDDTTGGPDAPSPEGGAAPAPQDGHEQPSMPPSGTEAS